MSAKRTTLWGLCTALAMILSYLESFIPPLAAIPGIKIGLPNVMIVFVLYKLGAKEAVAVSLVRLFLVSLLFGSTLTLLYSFAGALLSLSLMILLKKTNRFSAIGVSVVGGVAHNVGQIAVACIVMGTAQIVFYLPVLILSGVIAGIAVGIAGSLLIHRIKRI